MRKAMSTAVICALTVISATTVYAQGLGGAMNTLNKAASGALNNAANAMNQPTDQQPASTQTYAPISTPSARHSTRHRHATRRHRTHRRAHK